jgi:probable blue pigment (indigoidine) exporter
VKSIMRAAFNAIVPWVAITLLLKYLVDILQLPVGLAGTMSRAVTLVILGAWVLSTGQGWRRLVPRGEGGWLLVMGLVSNVINLCWFAAPKWTPATNVAMLVRLDVVFIAVIGAVLGLERLRAVQVSLLGVMLAGLALLTEIHKFDFSGHLLGDSMVVLAALGLAVNAFIIRGILEVMDETAVAFYNHAISAAGFVALAFRDGPSASFAAVLHQRSALLGILAMGLAASIQLPLYYIALRQLELWKLRMFFLLTPVLTAAGEWLLWNVHLSRWQCVGGGIILVGLAAMILVEGRSAGTRVAAEAVSEPVREAVRG